MHNGGCRMQQAGQRMIVGNNPRLCTASETIVRQGATRYCRDGLDGAAVMLRNGGEKDR